MRNFQDAFESRKRLFICAFSICMTVSLRNEMNEKAWFEIILKKWERVRYTTARSISMIKISMIINQNFGNT